MKAELGEEVVSLTYRGEKMNRENVVMNEQMDKEMKKIHGQEIEVEKIEG
jgi:hypothetical protein